MTGRTETIFDEYMECMENRITSELIQNLQFKLHSGSEDDEEYQEVVSLSFQNALICTEILRFYFFTYYTSKITFQDLDSSYKSLIITKR